MFQDWPPSASLSVTRLSLICCRLRSDRKTAPDTVENHVYAPGDIASEYRCCSLPTVVPGSVVSHTLLSRVEQKGNVRRNDGCRSLRPRGD